MCQIKSVRNGLIGTKHDMFIIKVISQYLNFRLPFWKTTSGFSDILAPLPDVLFGTQGSYNKSLWFCPDCPHNFHKVLEVVWMHTELGCPQRVAEGAKKVMLQIGIKHLRSFRTDSDRLFIAKIKCSILPVLAAVLKYVPCLNMSQMGLLNSIAYFCNAIICWS